MSDILNPSAGSPAPSSNSSESGGNGDSGGQPAGASPADWLTALPEELRGVAGAKGWKDPADAIRSYQNLESFTGADKAERGVVLPRDADDLEAFDKIYSALGRPEDVAGYELTSLFPDEREDDAFTRTMAETMHKAGLSKSQVQMLADAFKNQGRGILEASEARAQAELDEVMSGRDAQAQVGLAARGFKALGLPGLEDEIEAALGPKLTLQLFSAVGRALGGDRLPDGAQGVNGSGGPSTEIKRLEGDPMFMQRYMNGDKDAITTMDNLYKQKAAWERHE